MSGMYEKVGRQILITLGTVILIAGCGGGGGGGDSSNAPAVAPPSSPPAPIVLAPGKSYTLPANGSVLVPPGTTVQTNNFKADGLTTLTVTGSSISIYTETGSLVTVPSSATGAANNLIAALKAPVGAISTAHPTVTTIAGNASSKYLNPPVDGTGASAAFSGINHIALDPNGNAIVSDQNALRKVTQAGIVTTLAQASTLNPSGQKLGGVAIDTAGKIFVSVQTDDLPTNTVGGAINAIDATGNITDFVRNWPSFSRDFTSGLGDLVIDSQRNLFLSDPTNNRIVKFSSFGQVSIFAGNNTAGAIDGNGTAAFLTAPKNLAIDANDNIFFNDEYNKSIRKITPGGTVSTVAKDKTSNASGLLTPIAAIAIDAAGNIYFSRGPGSIARLDIRGFIVSYDIKEFQATNPQMMVDMVNTMVSDGKGNLYVATCCQGSRLWKISF